MKLKIKFLSIFAVFALSMAATSAWAGEVELTSDGNGGYYVNMPATGTNTLVNIPEGVTTFKVYDDGGPNKNFSLNCDGNLVLVAPENHFVRLNGTMVAVQLNGMSSGSLALYNSEISQSNKVFEEYGNVTIKWLSDGNTLILNFKNFDSRTPSAGLDLTVSFVSSSDPFLVDIVPVDGGNAVSSVTNVLQGALVSVTATPAEGYAFDHIEVYDERGNPIAVTGGTWLTSATGSFVMPATNAVVTPVFVAENIGPRVDMSWNGTTRYTIPEGLTVFGVYDYGGFECGEFSSPLVLTAPEGYVFLLHENIPHQSNESNSGFVAFDGDFEDPVGTDVEQMSYRGITSGRKLTLVHRPTCEANGKMGIRLLDASVTHSVEMSYKGNGYGEEGLSSASVGNPVNLTATPDDGYMIGRISADAISEYGSWWSVPITGGTWYTGNDYSFTMPYANVEVNVEFVEKMTTADEGLFIEMPKRDSVIATIPEDVESFNVTGGCDGGNCKGTLVLAAPEGLKFQLSGSVEFEGEDAAVTIYDGAGEEITEILKMSQGGDVHLNSFGNILTIKNVSRKTYESLNLIVTVVNPNKKYNVRVVNHLYGGTIVASTESAAPGEVVSVTASPAIGYIFSSLEIINDDNGYSLFYAEDDSSWYTNKTQFIMPNKDIYVEAYFNRTNEIGIEIPKEGERVINIPVGIKKINIFNSAYGDDWLYYNNSHGTLVLTAPEGYKFHVIGGEVAISDNGDSLVVYDGNDANSSKIAGVSSGDEIEELRSTGRSLAFRFTTDDVGNDYGIYLELELVNESGVYPVILDYSYCGSLVSNTELAVPGEKIVLTAYPEDGCSLNKITGIWKDEDHNEHKIDMIDGSWYTSNEALFEMPAGDVVLTADFVRESGRFDVSIPNTDELKINIQNEKASIGVFAKKDDQDYYFNNNDGTLVLTAPEGYSLRVESWLLMADEGDSLYIYDGEDANARSIAKLSVGDEIGQMFSSGRSLTFRFKTNEDGSNDEGICLNVSVIKNYGSPAVVVYDNEYGYRIAYVNGDYNGAEAVSIPEPLQVEGILYAREFAPYTPTTVVLPFSLPEGASVNAKFYKLSEVKQEGNSWKAYMTWIGEGNLPEANKPYAVVTSGDNHQLMFDWDYGKKATVQTTEIVKQEDLSGNWEFVGTYSYKVWDENDSELGLAYAFAGSNEKTIAKGKFGKIGAGSSANPMRAYLKKKSADVRLQPLSRPVAKSENHYLSSMENMPETIDVEFLDDGKTTAVGRMNTVTGEFKIDRWYDLKGRRLNHKPTTKGMYINNFKRVIVK